MGTQGNTLTIDQSELLEIIRLLRKQSHEVRRGYGEISFELGGVQPPSTEYLTRDSCLQINIYPATTTATVTISYKIMLPDGRVTTSADTFTGGSAYALNRYIRQLTEGFLLSLAVTISSGSTIHRGDTYVQVGLQFGTATTTPMYRLLAGGYVTTTCALAWPEGNISDSLTGPGLLNSTGVGNPAAGADWSLTFGSGQRLWIHAIYAQFAASAVAANRQAYLLLKDTAGHVLWELAPSTTMTAGATYNLNWTECATLSTGIAADRVIPLPTETYLYGGYIIGTSTANIDVGDQWSGIRIAAENWMEV